MQERSQTEPNVQSSGEQTLRGTQEGKLDQEAPEPSGLASRGLSALQDPSKGLGSGLSQERAEPQTVLTSSPQGHSEGTPQDQRGQSPQGYKGESIQGQDKGVPQSQSKRKQAQQGQELETPRFGEGCNTEVSGDVQGGATVWCQEEGNLQGHSNDFCKFPGKLIPQHVGKGIARPQGSSTQVTQAAATQEGAWAPLLAVPPSPPQLQCPKGGILVSEAQEHQPRLLSAPREQRGPRDPKPSKAAWPALRNREEVLASSGQEVLQRLLELNCAARQQRRRDREQQRLRVNSRSLAWWWRGWEGRPGGAQLTAASPGPGTTPHRCEPPPSPGSPAGAPSQCGSEGTAGKSLGKGGRATMAVSPEGWGGRQPAVSGGAQRKRGGAGRPPLGHTRPLRALAT